MLTSVLIKTTHLNAAQYVQIYTCLLHDFLIVPCFNKETQVGCKKDLKSKIIAEDGLYFKEIFCEKSMYLLWCFVIFCVAGISSLRG